jgi:2,5-diketo-D-gluconate reductase A
MKLCKLGLIALLAAGIAVIPAGEGSAKNVYPKNVPAVTLNNGMQMPQLGFGTFTLKQDVAVESVKEALRQGYRLIDCAQGYGNEAEVGRAIKESGIPRSEIFVTTKINTNVMREGTVRQSLDESIEKLGGTYIDLVLIHWPVEGKVEETWKIMEEYVRAGKIKAIGVSNFNPHHIDDLLKYATIKPVVNQIEMHPYMTQYDVAAYTVKRGIRPEAWGPLGQGRLGVVDDAVLRSLGEKYGKSPAQIVVRWHLQRKNIVIPRSQNPAHIAENINVFDFKLSGKDMKTIDALNKNQRANPKNDPDNFPW